MLSIFYFLEPHVFNYKIIPFDGCNLLGHRMRLGSLFFDRVGRRPCQRDRRFRLHGRSCFRIHRSGFNGRWAIRGHFCHCFPLKNCYHLMKKCIILEHAVSLHASLKTLTRTSPHFTSSMVPWRTRFVAMFMSLSRHRRRDYNGRWQRP